MDTPDRLSPESHEAIRQLNRQHYLGRATPQEKPVAIIIAGQPGAGKGRLASEADRELAERGNSVLIDPDELRFGHPHYGRHLREDDKTAAEKVHEDASLWAKELRRDAIEGRRNLVIDATLNDKEKARALCEQLRDAGYRIEVRALAVHERESRQGIHGRYEGAKEKGAPARWVPDHIHDESYKGMPIAVGHIERNGLADSVSIYRRDGARPYYNDQAARGVTGQSQTALLSERARERTAEEKREYAQGWDKIHAQMTKRHAGIEDMAKVSDYRLRAHSEARHDSEPKAEAHHVTTPQRRRQDAWMER